MSKNTFSISGDKIYITRPEWNYMACATVRDDYEEEIQNATWGLNNGRYLYNEKVVWRRCLSKHERTGFCY